MVTMLGNRTLFPENELSRKKRLFLAEITSKNRDSTNMFKRISTSPIRYKGGKTLALGYIIQKLPTNITRVVSPFFGGGSTEIALSKYLDLEVIGYDIFDVLVNYWQVQIQQPHELADALARLAPDRATFDALRAVLKQYWDNPVPMNPLQMARDFFFTFNLSYGPEFLGWTNDIYLDDVKYQRMVQDVREFTPNNLTVKCANFVDVLPNHQNDFIFADPPYYMDGDSKMFRGLYPNGNFPVHHKGFPHDKLRDILKAHRGGFILTYNDCSTIREWYKDYEQTFPSWQYTLGQGETRIGKNRLDDDGDIIKESHEILIYCPPQK